MPIILNRLEDVRGIEGGPHGWLVHHARTQPNDPEVVKAHAELSPLDPGFINSGVGNALTACIASKSSERLTASCNAAKPSPGRMPPLLRQTFRQNPLKHPTSWIVRGSSLETKYARAGQRRMGRNGERRHLYDVPLYLAGIYGAACWTPWLQYVGRRLDDRESMTCDPCLREWRYSPDSSSEGKVYGIRC